jgi:hypothetical protein
VNGSIVSLKLENLVMNFMLFSVAVRSLKNIE